MAFHITNEFVVVDNKIISHATVTEDDTVVQHIQEDVTDKVVSLLNVYCINEKY